MKKLKFIHSSKKEIFEGKGFKLLKISGVTDPSITKAARENAENKNEKIINFANVIISIGDNTPDWIREDLIKKYNSIKENSTIFVDAFPTVKQREYNDKTYIDVIYNVFGDFGVDNSSITSDATSDGIDFTFGDDGLPF